MMLAGVTWDDMPKLEKYNKLEGNNFFLGKCTGRYCTHKQGHAPPADIPADFASTLCALLKPGIDNMTPCLMGTLWPEFKNVMETKQGKKQRTE